MTEHVERAIAIDASRDQVWTVLADIGAISNWASPVLSSEVDGEPGEGATRHCTLADGARIDERFVAWEEQELQRYEATGDVPAVAIVSEWCLDEGPDGQTVATYRASFDPGEETAVDEVRDELTEMAEHLVDALKVYIESGDVLEPPEP